MNDVVITFISIPTKFSIFICVKITDQRMFLVHDRQMMMMMWS